jgi:hypothetical protein
LLCGSINVRERPWASKRQPIDYKRCCTDRLNAHSESGQDCECVPDVGGTIIPGYVRLLERL